MKASELILQIVELIKNNGDCEVYTKVYAEEPLQLISIFKSTLLIKIVNEDGNERGWCFHSDSKKFKKEFIRDSKKVIIINWKNYKMKTKIQEYTYEKFNN